MISFFNFPYDFNPKDNIFLEVLSDQKFKRYEQIPIDIYGSYPRINLIKKIMLYFGSRFSNKLMTNWLRHKQGVPEKIDPSHFNIWCTFENRRPPHKLFDITLSFDQDDFGDTNFYLPLFFLYQDIKGTNSAYVKHKIEPSQLLKIRSREEIPRKNGFAVSFINNPEMMRLRAISEIEKIDKVEVFGRSVNNYIQNKIEMGRKYWFNVCFENDLYPGYVTEKVLEAWLSYAIPIYWGDDVEEILNPRAILNLKNFESLSDLKAEIQKIYLDKDRMEEMICEPLLKKTFSVEKLEDFILLALKKRFV